MAIVETTTAHSLRLTLIAGKNDLVFNFSRYKPNALQIGHIPFNSY